MDVRFMLVNRFCLKLELIPYFVKNSSCFSSERDWSVCLSLICFIKDRSSISMTD